MGWDVVSKEHAVQFFERVERQWFAPMKQALAYAVEADREREAAKREEAEAIQGTARARTEAAEIIGRAKTEADGITKAGTDLAERKRADVALLAGDEAQLTGRVNELRVEEKRLVDRIKALAAGVAKLEAVEPH